MAAKEPLHASDPEELIRISRGCQTEQMRVELRTRIILVELVRRRWQAFSVPGAKGTMQNGRERSSARRPHYRLFCSVSNMALGYRSTSQTRASTTTYRPVTYDQRTSDQEKLMLRYWTAGESHGKTLLAMVDGFPAGVTIDTDWIDQELARRQGGYGRGGRQRIETDKVDVLTGIWQGTTLGGPVALQVINKDYKLERLDELPRPRPGHGDLTGAIKYLGSIRGVLERASARETAVRVAAGALARQLLRHFSIEALGYVTELGGVAAEPKTRHDRKSSPSSRRKYHLFAQAGTR